MIGHAKDLVDDLHRIWKRSPEEIERFVTPMQDRDGGVTTSRFAASTHSIQFYDSMIVFEKRPRAEPYSQFR